ncbi:MAG: acyl-CoA dehydrogenase family protein, partial [Rhodoblastus sp.]|nr:acyl-CoA dehydrogenase family protein [Rhodoblastus sp.]
MNFDDTPQEAEFRAIARKWIEANRPDDLMRDLAAADEIKDRDQRTAALVKAAKAWQKKKADAGFACLTWPKEYGGRAATPIQRVIWDQEEGKYG